MTADRQRPLIAVSWVKRGDVKSERYLAAVWTGGAEALPLLAKAKGWRKELDRAQGLVLTGGGDIDPRLYAEQNRSCRDVDPHRDDLELEALRICRERGLPVLAICRGHQLVNVFHGGAVVQDIPREVPGSLQHGKVGGDSSYHEIDVVAGTRLATVLGGERRILVNSRHHQGVALGGVGKGLRVTALADDGIVEGLESETDDFLITVQCHPEYLEQVPVLTGVFRLLVTEARDRQR